MFGFNPIPISTVDINGIYIKESSENFFEYLKSFGNVENLLLMFLYKTNWNDIKQI